MELAVKLSQSQINAAVSQVCEWRFAAAGPRLKSVEYKVVTTKKKKLRCINNNNQQAIPGISFFFFNWSFKNSSARFASLADKVSSHSRTKSKRLNFVVSIMTMFTVTNISIAIFVLYIAFMGQKVELFYSILWCRCSHYFLYTLVNLFIKHKGLWNA